MKYSDSLLFGAAMVGGALLFFLVLYRPAQEEIRFLREQIRATQERNVDEGGMTRLLDEKNRTVTALQQEVERLRSSLLSPGGSSSLMSEIRTLCSRLGFRDEAVTLKGRVPGRPFDAVVLEVRLLGAFEGIYRFLQGMEALPTTVRVDHLELKGMPGGADNVMASITVSAPLSVF